MAQIFPEWTNKIPAIGAVAGAVVPVAVIAGIWIYFSPEHTDVGYRPVQPIPYDHSLHAGDLGIDCRYCHVGVEVSPVANIPTAETCMNCHRVVKQDSEQLAPLRAAINDGTPIEWVRVHDLPEYSFFDHSVHVNAGVGCVSCHGRIDEMVVVRQEEPLSMSWCLDCHRLPEPHLRPLDQITNMRWNPSPEHATLAAQWRSDRGLAPPEDCSACHR